MTRPLAPPCQTTERHTKLTRTPLASRRGAAGRGVEQIKGNAKDTNGLGFWGYTGNQTPSRALGKIHGFAGFLASVPEKTGSSGIGGLAADSRPKRRSNTTAALEVHAVPYRATFILTMTV